MHSLKLMISFARIRLLLQLIFNHFLNSHVIRPQICTCALGVCEHLLQASRRVLHKQCIK